MQLVSNESTNMTATKVNKAEDNSAAPVDGCNGQKAMHTSPAGMTEGSTTDDEDSCSTSLSND